MIVESKSSEMFIQNASKDGSQDVFFRTGRIGGSNSIVMTAKTMGAAIALMLTLVYSQSAKANIPFIDDQPSADANCPILVPESTENSDGSIGVRHYGCDVDGTNVVYTVSIPPGCESGGCGLILDNHGATMSAAQQNAGTKLRQFGWHATDRGAQAAYIVVQPNLTDLFDTQNPFDIASVVGGAYTNELSNIAFFIEHLAAVYQVDNDRMHMYGFSRGASTVSAIYCDVALRQLFASYAVGGGGISCALDAPLMIVNGISDPGKMQMNNALEDEVKAISGYSKTVIVNNPNWSTPSYEITWTGIHRKGNHRHIRLQAGAVMLESIKHSGSSYPAAGHCHANSDYNGWLTCYANMETGAKLLDFFIQNPR